MTESPNTIEETETMANAAVRYGKSIWPGGTYGGRLVIAQIGRDFMSTQVRPVQEIAISGAARTSAIRDQSVQQILIARSGIVITEMVRGVPFAQDFGENRPSNQIMSSTSPPDAVSPRPVSTLARRWNQSLREPSTFPEQTVFFALGSK